jgi:hypothetical protein
MASTADCGQPSKEEILNFSTKLRCAILGACSLILIQGLMGQTSGTNTSGSTSGGSTPSTTGTSGGPGVVGRQVSLHVPDESAPPGGIVQMKLLITEPTPISSGGPRIPKPSGTTVSGVQLFNPNGDVSGVAMISASAISVASISSTGAQGSDYPIMTIALQLPTNVSIGTKLPFTLDPSSSWNLGLLGNATVKPFPQATITVGGSISITNVVPGGGLLPGGSVVSVQGIGFEPGTQVQLSNVQTSSITVVSPQEIQIVLAEPTQMTGKKIQVANPDGSKDTYYSYMRGIQLDQSTRPLLASAKPIFSSIVYSQAAFASGLSMTTSQYDGLAVQNPNLAPATVTFTLFSAANAPLGSSTVVIPNGNYLMKETSELTGGVAPPAGSYIVVSSDSPIQVFGFLADDLAGTVLPYVALSSPY